MSIAMILEGKKIILFELNEVPLRILEHYRAVSRRSWIAQKFDRFEKFETVSENIGHLSPWNTWPTVHRGVSNERHYISDFNQDLSTVDDEFPPIWRILSRSGIRSGIFGSLHSYPIPEDLTNYDFYVPDVFAADSDSFPHPTRVFQDVNLRLSRESARNVDPSIPYRSIFQLLRNSAVLGFRPSTAIDVGSHLVSERLRPWKSTRRRTYQSVIAFDIFLKLLSTRRPDFATFFTNHVASSMHRYWAALFPGDYENLRFESDWVDTYDSEIVFAMERTDRMLARLGRFVDKDPSYALLITSSMGQHAVECEPIETQLYVDNEVRFMAMLEVPPGDFHALPSMLPQFNFSVAGVSAVSVEAALENLRVNGENVTFRRLEGRGFSVDFGHPNLKETMITMNGTRVGLDESGLKNVVIEDRSASTAYHIPEGHLFCYHPSNSASVMHKTELPTTEIAPILLKNFGVAVPDHMRSAG